MRDVVIKAVENDEELRQANVLMASAHEPDPSEGPGWLITFGTEYPDFRREHTRIAVYKDEVVGALRITTDTIRIGESRLRVGGLGMISATLPWRRKGLGARIVSDALNYMKEQQYHVAMIFSTSDFYRRWGFSTALADYSLVLDLSKMDTLLNPQKYKIRTVKPGDISVLQKLHMVNDAETACSLIRTQAHMANKWGRWKSVRVISDTNGKVIAYFRGIHQKQEYVVDEMGVANHEACLSILHAISQYAHQECVGRVRFCAPPTHPLLLFLRDCPSEHEMEIHISNSGMMTFVNLDETLESMIPEWEGMLEKSSMARSRVEITLLVGKIPLRVRANRGAVSMERGIGINKVAVSPNELVQMLTGFLHLEETLPSHRRIVNADGMELLRLLFPKRLPHVWTIDRF